MANLRTKTTTQVFDGIAKTVKYASHVEGAFVVIEGGDRIFYTAKGEAGQLEKALLSVLASDEEGFYYRMFKRVAMAYENMKAQQNLANAEDVERDGNTIRMKMKGDKTPKTRKSIIRRLWEAAQKD